MWKYKETGNFGFFPWPFFLLQVTENVDTAPIKEKYYPPIDTSKDVYTNKSVIIVNPPDYSTLEAAAVDDIGIGKDIGKVIFNSSQKQATGL